MLTTNLATMASLWLTLSVLAPPPTTSATGDLVLTPAAQAGFERLRDAFDPAGPHRSEGVITAVRIDKDHAVVHWRHSDHAEDQRLILRPPGGAVAVGPWFSSDLPDAATATHIAFTSRLNDAVLEAFATDPWLPSDGDEPTLPASPTPVPGPSPWLVGLVLLGVVAVAALLAWF